MTRQEVTSAPNIFPRWDGPPKFVYRWDGLPDISPPGRVSRYLYRRARSVLITTGAVLQNLYTGGTVHRIIPSVAGISVLESPSRFKKSWW